MGSAVRSIVATTQCAPELAAQSVLGAASLVTARHYSVAHPLVAIRGGGQKSVPLALFMMSVASSGERKSTVQNIVYESIHDYGRGVLRPAHAGGFMPVPRAERPKLIITSGTSQAMFGMMQKSEAVLGFLNAEGGNILGGHSFKDADKARSSGFLIDLWDGSTVEDNTRTNGLHIIEDQLLTLDIGIQPLLARSWLDDPLMRSNGLLNRMLIVSPKPRAGSRTILLSEEVDRSLADGADPFQLRMKELLLIPIPMKPNSDGGRGFRNPSTLSLSEEAKLLVKQFAQECEGKLAPGAEWEEWGGYATRLPEQALRIAGVLAAFEVQALPSQPNELAPFTISEEVTRRAIELAKYYIEEFIRIVANAVNSEIDKKAAALAAWLCGNGFVSMKALHDHGPGRWTREKQGRERVLRHLAAHGWVVEETRREHRHNVRYVTLTEAAVLHLTSETNERAAA